MSQAANDNDPYSFLPCGVGVGLSGQVVAGSRAVFLAVKPDVIPMVLQEINDHVSEDTLVVSIAMGVSVATLEQVGVTLWPVTYIKLSLAKLPCLGEG